METKVQQGDEKLVDKIRAGSRSAFAELMNRHERLVFRICYSYARQEDSALDISQEVFVKVWRYLPDYEGRGSFRGWLMRIAHRESMNWLRAERRHGESDELTRTNTPSVDASQEEELLRREQRSLLWIELDKLNKKQRLALSLRHFEQMSITEIAAALDCSESVAKNILFRGLAKLRRNLAQRRWNHEGLRALSASTGKQRRG